MTEVTESQSAIGSRGKAEYVAGQGMGRRGGQVPDRGKAEDVVVEGKGTTRGKSEGGDEREQPEVKTGKMRRAAIAFAVLGWASAKVWAHAVYAQQGIDVLMGCAVLAAAYFFGEFAASQGEAGDAAGGVVDAAEANAVVKSEDAEEVEEDGKAEGVGAPEGDEAGVELPPPPTPPQPPLPPETPATMAWRALDISKLWGCKPLGDDTAQSSPSTVGAAAGRRGRG